MRINVNRPRGTSNDTVSPVDPMPPSDVNDHFELELTASTTRVQPFHDVEISWTITSRGETRVSDYIFDLVETSGPLTEDLDATGATTLAPYRNTLVRVQGRRRGRAGSVTLGAGLALSVDGSDCEIVELPAILVDGLVTDGLTQLTSETASLRLRKRLVSVDPVQWVQREVEPSWEVGSVSYYFPLEVVINNFFNADLDVEVTIRPAVHHDGDDTDLEVTITHSSDVDFDTFEDIVSLGHSATAAKTADKLLPLVIASAARGAEREIVRQVLAFIRGRLETHRLLAVRVVPNGNLSYLAMVLRPMT